MALTPRLEAKSIDQWALDFHVPQNYPTTRVSNAVCRPRIYVVLYVFLSLDAEDFFLNIKFVLKVNF